MVNRTFVNYLQVSFPGYKKNDFRNFTYLKKLGPLLFSINQLRHVKSAFIDVGTQAGLFRFARICLWIDTCKSYSLCLKLGY